MPSLYQIGKVNSRHNFTFSDIYQHGKYRQHLGMTNEEIRRENARWLARAFGGPVRFAEAIDVSDSRVSQLIGKNPTKKIGDATARRIEEAYGKPTGWMDTPNAWQAEEGGDQVLVPVDVASRLLSLFGSATEGGREQIIRAAELAEKKK